MFDDIFLLKKYELCELFRLPYRLEDDPHDGYFRQDSSTTDDDNW